MKIKKRNLLIILIIIMILNFNFTVNAASNNKEIEHIANIIYFVDFNDSQGNFMEGKMDMVKDMFDGKKDTSLSSYIKKISYNQMNVHNYFPQEKNGRITPYRLSNNRSYYNKSNEHQMIEEVIKNVQVDGNYNIDMNNDGYVDNVIFVFNGKATEVGDVLWPHKANHNGATSVNGKKVNVYNLHNSYRLINDILGGEGVLSHEFLHSVGYPDLYKADGNNDPVGIWDIMASTSPFLQYPLAYTRSAISNWITIDTITESGTYTLKPSSSADGDQAFILKTPMSNSEFFVVEYRKKGNPYKYELDSKIPGSGLIIYRINTDEKSNYVGEKDYIYIFRPGETGEGDGKGNIFEAFLSKESGRTSYGSSDFNKKIGDKAITYSSGQNSGIVIENVSEAGDEITFDIKFEDVSNLGVWELVGNEPISNNVDYYMDMDVVDNKIYTVYSEGEMRKVLKAKMYDGTRWVPLGDSILNEEGFEPKIKVFNGVPYVLYHDKNYKSVVAKFQGGKWQKLQELTRGVSQYSDMIATDNGLYVTYTELGTEVLKVSKLNLSNNKFEALGDAVHTGYITSPSISEMDGDVYVSFTDFYKGNKVYVKKYENGKWIDINGLDLSAASVMVKACNDGIYIGTTPNFDGNGAEVYFYNGESWKKVGESIGSNQVMYMKLDVYKGTPYIAYIDNKKISTEVKYFDGVSWVNEGLNVSNEKTNNINFKIDNAKAYVGINSYNTSSFFVKSKSIGEEIIEDINGDGNIDLLDLSLVALKYNLQNTDNGFDEKCDLNKDGIIDIFDLVYISKKYLK